MNITITKSDKPDKKYMALVNNKKVHFGSKPYQDMTQHKDEDRKDRYIQRHKKREDWTKSGIDTPGFYSRWVLWEEPTLKESINKMNKNIKILILN